MGKKQILIVEDDKALAEILAYNLHQVGYIVHCAHDGREGLHRALLNPPDVILLDVMLPQIDGIEVCRQIRCSGSTRHCLVMMLTARSEEIDQLVGFGVGADDYVVKPFTVRVLLQRIRALLRRREHVVDERRILVSQGIVIDRRSHRASAHGAILPLTKSEFMLLDALLSHVGRSLTRAELISAALGDDAIVLERTIDVHIRALRKKLGHLAHLIETVRGVGYRFHDPNFDVVSC